jgi:predicted O-methyltransferase YrrM
MRANRSRRSPDPSTSCCWICGRTYIQCFELFYPKLGSGAMVVADNLIVPEFSRRDAEDYRRHVRAKADLQSVLLPVGSGIEVSRCTRGLEFK